MNRIVVALVAILALMTNPAAQATDLFVYEDVSDQLPLDPGADGKDSLDVELVDVDSDGDPDIFLVEGSADPFGFANRLWINDGTGQFTDESAARIPQDAANSAEVDFADVDGDGDPDAVVSNVGANQLLINDDAGYFSLVPLPQATPPGPPGFPVSFPPFFLEISAEAVFADVDGDGAADILVSNENPFPFGPPGDLNRLLINDGTGQFVEAPGQLAEQLGNTGGIAAVDIDADGDLDLIEGNVSEPNRVLVNSGGGFFVDETAARLAGPADSTRKLAVGDVDNDGDPDIVVGNSRGEQNRLYLNDGTGHFVDVTATHLPADSSSTTDLKLEDLDADGDPDLFVVNVGSFVFNHGFLGEPNRLLFNDGNGVFSEATAPRLVQRDNRSINAEFGDVDGDGTRDLVVANSGGVSQPGLPPPDGAEELLVRRDCADFETLCLERTLDALGEAVDALDTAAFPDGDMTSRRVTRNERRKALLQRWVNRAEQHLEDGRRVALAIRLVQLEARTDGVRRPHDWVTGPAADLIDRVADFGLDVLLPW